MLLFNKYTRGLDLIKPTLVSYILYGFIVVSCIIIIGTKQHSFVNNEECDEHWSKLTLFRFTNVTVCIMILYALHLYLVVEKREFALRLVLTILLLVIHVTVLLLFIMDDVFYCWDVNKAIRVIINTLRVIIIIDILKHSWILYFKLYRLTKQT